jgi:RNA recognition motif-containing protein
MLQDVDDQLMAKISTLYVSQIPIHVSEEQLHTLFCTYGDITKCRVVKNTYTKESRGFAFIEFKERQVAINAMNGLKGHDLYGSKLDIVLARPQLDQNKTKQQPAPGPVRRCT